MLGLGGIDQRNAAQDFGREIGQAGEADRLSLGQRVTDTQRAVVGDTDDIARPGFLRQFTVLREEHDRAVDRDRLAMARGRQFHAPPELARAEPHERNPVAVLRVHIGLHLEDEAGDIVVIRRHRLGLGRLGARRRGVIGQCLDQFGNAEFFQRRAEIDRGQVAMPIGFGIECAIAVQRQLGLFLQMGQPLRGNGIGQCRIVEPGIVGHLPFERTAVARWLTQDIAVQVVNAFELATHADRPTHRRDIEREHVGDLVEQFERRAPFAINLVDEGDDRHRPHAANLEQLARLRLDPLGCVDHHHRGINRSERAIGVFGEVFVARRVEQVEGHAVALEGHHRRGDRNAALLLDLHPVGSGAAVRPARLDFAGQVDGASEEQQLFGERGLTGVRMGDDRKGATVGAIDGHDFGYSREIQKLA